MAQCSCSVEHGMEKVFAVAVLLIELYLWHNFSITISNSALVPRTLCNTKIGLTSVINEYMQLLKNKHLQWKC